MRNFTEAGEKAGYTQEAIDKAVGTLSWEPFTGDLPFSQGYAIREVAKSCGIPRKSIESVALDGFIEITGARQHGFYGLKVNYSNGPAHIYIADSGLAACVVASDFEERKEALNA